MNNNLATLLTAFAHRDRLEAEAATWMLVTGKWEAAMYHAERIRNNQMRIQIASLVAYNEEHADEPQLHG